MQLSEIQAFVGAGNLTIEDIIADEYKILFTIMHTHSCYEWLINYFEVPNEIFRTNRCEIFIHFCSNGMLETAKWICKRAQITKQHIDCRYTFEKVFPINKNRHVIEWLVREFDNIWLAKTLNLPSIYVYRIIQDEHWDAQQRSQQQSHQDCIEAMHESIEAEYLEHIQWILNDIVQFEYDEIQKFADMMFIDACISGNLQIARWVCQEYGSIDLIHENTIRVFQKTYNNKHYHVIQWLVDEIDMPDIRAHCLLVSGNNAHTIYQHINFDEDRPRASGDLGPKSAAKVC